MKLAIDLRGKHLIVPADKAAAIIDAIGHGKLYNKKGWNDTSSADFIEVDAKEKPELCFIQEAQLAPPEVPIVKLNAELESANTRWYSQYQETQVANKKVKELEEKLKCFTDLVPKAVSNEV